MFRKSQPAPKQPKPVKPEPPPRRDRKEQSFLQRGVRMKGDLLADGDVRVEGEVVGTLQVGGALVIGPGASVEGLMKGDDVVVHGKAKGTIEAGHRIHLARGARVEGDLFCESLIIEEGVYFSGRSHMGERRLEKGTPGLARGGGRSLETPPATANHRGQTKPAPNKTPVSAKPES